MLLGTYKVTSNVIYGIISTATERFFSLKLKYMYMVAR